MRKAKIQEEYTFCEESSFYDGYLKSFLYCIGYLCERMISLRGDMSAENNEKHQKIMKYIW